MAISQMSAIWYSTLTPPRKLVALALADWADDQGRCYPAVATIARKTGYSKRNTQRVIHDLVELGYVEILEPATPRTPPTYRLHPDRLEHRKKGRQDGTPTRKKGRQPDTSEVTAATPQRRQDGTPRGDKMSPNTSEDTPEISPGESSESESLEIERVVDTFPLEGLEVIDAEEQRRVTVMTPYLDTLVDWFGEPTRDSGWALYNELANKAHSAGHGPEEITERAAALAHQWGAKALTASSLLKWWGRFGTEIGKATEGQVDEMRDELERRRRRQRLEKLADNAGALEAPLPPDSPERAAQAALIASIDTDREEQTP